MFWFFLMYIQKILLSSIVVACVIGFTSGCARIIPAPTIERVIVPISKDSPRIYQYRVRSGDTLYAISRLHGISVDEIAHMNDISAPYVIYAGQRLVVDRLLVATDRAATAENTRSISVETSVQEPTNDSSSQTVSRSQRDTSGVKVTKLPKPSITRQEVAATNPSKSSLQSQKTPSSQNQTTMTSASVENRASPEKTPEAQTPRNENSLSSVEPTTDQSASTVSLEQVAPATSEQALVVDTSSKSTTQNEVPSSSTETAEVDTKSFVARTEPADASIKTSSTVDFDALPKGWVWPVSANPTNSYGKDDGLNYYLNQGNEVFAAASGRVTYAGIALSDFKYMVLIKTPDEYVIQYDFNVALNVQENDLISKGQRLTKIENTNKGQHNTISDKYRKLFFAIWKKGVSQNPNKLIATPKTGEI